MSWNRFAASLLLALSALQCSHAAAPVVDEAELRRLMATLAGDGMRGRASASPDERAAAEFIATQLQAYGLKPAQPGGFVVTVPMQGTLATTVNVIGVRQGSDPAAGAVLLSAHLDHLGVGRPVGRDDIYNGADDDASGVIAAMMLARALAAGPAPRRTLLVALFGSEEIGGLGAQHFLAQPPVPLARIVANLEFEMIGRPDPAVPPRTLWLTGYERSNLGATFAARGARLHPDPHPKQQFFMRSDNYHLALKGVVAHTVSSFSLHRDYHQPSDDIARIDFPHMTQAIHSLVEPVRWLLDSDFVPAWNPGGAPVAHDR
jgi:hypothetical protein